MPAGNMHRQKGRQHGNKDKDKTGSDVMTLQHDDLRHSSDKEMMGRAAGERVGNREDNECNRIGDCDKKDTWFMALFK